MFKKILNDRLGSIADYEEYIKNEKRKLSHHKELGDGLIKIKAIEYEKAITEILSFMDTYKKKLTEFLQEKTYTMEMYNKKLFSYDNHLTEIFKSIRDKEDAFKEVTK